MGARTHVSRFLLFLDLGLNSYRLKKTAAVRGGLCDVMQGGAPAEPERVVCSLI